MIDSTPPEIEDDCITFMTTYMRVTQVPSRIIAVVARANLFGFISLSLHTAAAIRLNDAAIAIIIIAFPIPFPILPDCLFINETQRSITDIIPIRPIMARVAPANLLCFALAKSSTAETIILRENAIAMIPR